MNIKNDFEKEYTLNITKIRDVDTPLKSYNAAGFDFYIPKDLHITDFTKNYEIYDNNFIEAIKDDNLSFSTSEFILTDDSIYISIRFALNKNGKFAYKIGKSSDGYPFNNQAEIISWIESPSTKVAAITILPYGKVLIPSGIKVNLPSNVFLKAENKSGISSKRGLIFGASTIDSDYQGEIHLSLLNPTNIPVKIIAGEKIIQYIPMFSPNMKKVNVIENEKELYENANISLRGENGFGSTDIISDNTNIINEIKRGKGRPPKNK